MMNDSLAAYSAGRSFVLHQEAGIHCPTEDFHSLFFYAAVFGNLTQGERSGKNHCPGNSLVRRGRFQPMNRLSHAASMLSARSGRTRRLVQKYIDIVRFRFEIAGTTLRWASSMKSYLSIFPPKWNPSSIARTENWFGEKRDV